MNNYGTGMNGGSYNNMNSGPFNNNVTGTINPVNKVRNVINYIIIAITIALIGYFAIDYFMGEEVLTSGYGLFEITVPSRYNFINNDNADEEFIMGKIDVERKLYIFALAYENEDVEDFKKMAEEDYKYLSENEGINMVSKLDKIEIRDYEAYVASYTYIDDDGELYYNEYYMINCDNGYYLLFLEVPDSKKNTYKKDFKKIAQTFKELR